MKDQDSVLKQRRTTKDLSEGKDHIESQSYSSLSSSQMEYQRLQTVSNYELEAGRMVGREHSRKQKKISKTTISISVNPFMKKPKFLRWKGPGVKRLRPLRRFATIGMAYDTVVMMMKDPVKLLNPTGLPSGIAPIPDAITATKRVDSTGVPSFALTLLKYLENGTASSRASVQ